MGIRILLIDAFRTVYRLLFTAQARVVDARWKIETEYPFDFGPDLLPADNTTIKDEYAVPDICHLSLVPFFQRLLLLTFYAYSGT